MQQSYLVLDFETRSRIDLTKGEGVGGYEYGYHPTTQILCVGWAVGTKEDFKKRRVPAKVWSPALPSPYGELRRALLNPNLPIIAHNAFFEQSILKFKMRQHINDPYIENIPSSRFICTASMARALALPGALEGACQALKLAVQKDTKGHKLMMKLARSREPSKFNPNSWHNSVTDLKQVMEYCRVDVEAESLLFASIPELSPSERELWLLDQKINFRGVRVDRPLVAKISDMIQEELVNLAKELRGLTKGEVEKVTQGARFLRWVNSNGGSAPNLKAETVEQILVNPEGWSDVAIRAMEIRQMSSKTSTAKYNAFWNRTQSDSRLRDHTIYHGASTGRFSGAGVQPHNFPKPKDGIDALEAVAMIEEEDCDLETIQFFYRNPLSVFATTLRPMFRASEGKELYVGDFAGIEARVVFWLAKHEKGLQAFREGRDLYREIAAVIYNKKIEDVTKEEREIGKRVILGAGFGMGHVKFAQTCAQFGTIVSEELAKKAIESYRNTHHLVPKLWSNLELAAIEATLHPGKKYTINRTSWWVKDKFLWCELPSGRRLAYYGPTVKMEPTPWGEKRRKLYHWGVDPKTKQWVNGPTYGGKLTENMAQAVARDQMTGAMKRLEAKDFEILITVHDEIVCETDKKRDALDEFNTLMCYTEKWAEGLPVTVGAWKGDRYRK